MPSSSHLPALPSGFFTWYTWKPLKYPMTLLDGSVNILGTLLIFLISHQASLPQPYVNSMTNMGVVQNIWVPSVTLVPECHCWSAVWCCRRHQRFSLPPSWPGQKLAALSCWTYLCLLFCFCLILSWFVCHSVVPINGVVSVKVVKTKKHGSIISGAWGLLPEAPVIILQEACFNYSLWAALLSSPSWTTSPPIINTILFQPF